MGPEVIIAALVGAGGIGTLIFTALKFRREEAGVVVEQSAKLIAAMRELVDELEETLNRCRVDRERYRIERDALRDALRRRSNDG